MYVVLDELLKFYSDTIYRFIQKTLKHFIISINFSGGKDGRLASSTDSCEEFDGGVGYATVILLCHWSYGACVNKLSHTLHSPLRNAWSSWVFCIAQPRVVLEFFIPLLAALPHRLVFSELAPIISLYIHNRLPSCILNNAKTFCAQIAAIFIHPAPLAATDETKRPRQLQVNLASFCFCMRFSCWCVNFFSFIYIYIYIYHENATCDNEKNPTLCGW